MKMCGSVDDYLLYNSSNSKKFSPVDIFSCLYAYNEGSFANTDVMLIQHGGTTFQKVY